MFDVGFSELVLLAIVALVVLGPEKLPHAARVAGAWVARIRRAIMSVQTEIEREVAAQEVRQQLEKQFQAMGGQHFVEGLEAERRDLENTLKDAAAPLQQASAQGLTFDASMPIAPVVIQPVPDALPTAVDSAAPVLPDASTPPDEVKLDGEAAYRDWLAAQRRENRIAPASPDAAKDSSA